MLSRTPLHATRGRQTSRRICASCLFAHRASSFATTTQRRQAQHSTETTEPERPAQSLQPKTTSSTGHNRNNENTETTQNTTKRVPRGPRRERRPQPGPPNPPWPKPRSAQNTATRPHMSHRALADNAILISRMRGLLHRQTKSLSASFAQAEGIDTNTTLSVGVPRLPDLETDYTEVGPGIVAPWQPGGASFRTLNVDQRAVGALGGSKRMGVKLRVCDTHVIHPYSVKFLGSSNDIAPAGTGFTASTFQLNSLNSDGTTQTAFPHCLSEVVRRWYANKNRTDPLWWYVGLISNDNAGGVDLATVKNVVRSKTHAKVQHAFKMALARKGYSPAGWPLHTQGTASIDGEAPVVPRYPHLFGSVRVDAVLQRVLEADYQELVEYMAGLIKGVEADLGGKGRVVDGVVVYSGPETYRTFKRSPSRYKA
ncbi:hypothetical protein F503_01218 [Ophiostoma piceae UAMH 11346]|uniref:Uncharacterized protein n=1 Tax=Ophiostoma piceae (strain UAMH 11346) TaxID=1262450 RepID=S3D4V1_OPHP1|nr:hypothetical protein F503_01218 [Ophiostoma piceae UAMH 11346]